MKKTLTISLVVIAGIVLSALIFGAGLVTGRANFGVTGFGPAGMMNWGANNNYSGYGMMGNGYNNQANYGMMGNGYNNQGSYGMMGNDSYNPNSYGMMGNGYNTTNGYGMMDGFGNVGNTAAQPLTIDQTKQAVENYLKDLNNADLTLTEIMIFDNNGYARITEKSTGIGAMELLVDPASLTVFPEYGPNMMWNLKYGMMGTNSMMGGNGMMGSRGMMGNTYTNNNDASATMTVTAEQAGKIAQDYLDKQFPGYTVSSEPDAFYGYYTLDTLKDGQPTGMLSINGFSGQVFLHTWHGTFIEMWE